MAKNVAQPKAAGAGSNESISEAVCPWQATSWPPRWPTQSFEIEDQKKVAPKKGIVRQKEALNEAWRRVKVTEYIAQQSATWPGDWFHQCRHILYLLHIIIMVVLSKWKTSLSVRAAAWESPEAGGCWAQSTLASSSLFPTHHYASSGIIPHQCTPPFCTILVSTTDSYATLLSSDTIHPPPHLPEPCAAATW